MDEYETGLWFKCYLKVLEDVKAVALHKHANRTGGMHVLLSLNKERSILDMGKRKTVNAIVILIALGLSVHLV